MQVVTAVVVGKHAIRMGPVHDRRLEVDHRIEVSRGPDPGIHLRPVGFVGGIGVIELRAAKREDRPADDFDPVRVRSRRRVSFCRAPPRI
jgi:hypothetical protein